MEVKRERGTNMVVEQVQREALHLWTQHYPEPQVYLHGSSVGQTLKFNNGTVSNR